MKTLLGLHHVTAICRDAQANLDFYTGTLGLRLVKLTVNFDDPGAYHLYYGDGAGTPGTILTFFPYPDGQEGRAGVGGTTAITLSVPPASIPFWSDRLGENALVTPDGLIELTDPDGILLRLLPDTEYERPIPFEGSPVPREHAIGKVHSVILEEASIEPTEETLGLLGIEKVVRSGDLYSFEIGEGGPAKTVQVLVRSGAPRARGGPGSVHHVAFRCADDEAQSAWRDALVKEGYSVSPITDRDYFRSIYFREPGGVLFEIATDGPGFAADERPEALGTALKLPPPFEPHRAQIEAALPPLRLPHERHVDDEPAS